MKKYDVIIGGGGPGGSALASYLCQNGVSVAVLDKQQFPRFQIGESLLPASVKIFKELGFFSELDSGKYIRKYGARFVDVQTDEEIYFYFKDCQDPDMDYAFEVPRMEFDHDILKFAGRQGAEIFEMTSIEDVIFSDSGVTVKTPTETFEGKYFADFTGRQAYLGNKLKLRHSHPILKNVAVFCHYDNMERGEGHHEGDITIGVLPGSGWSWFIPFRGNRTSVGVVCAMKDYSNEQDMEKYHSDVFGQSRILSRAFTQATRSNEVRMVSNYSASCETFMGDRWLLGGDAAIFLDPIFSSGVHVSLTSGRLASKVFLEALQSNASLKDTVLGQSYESTIRTGTSRFYNMIDLFYQKTFIAQTRKVLDRKMIRRWYTGAVGGDVWNPNNILFDLKAL